MNKKPDKSFDLWLKAEIGRQQAMGHGEFIGYSASPKEVDQFELVTLIFEDAGVMVCRRCGESVSFKRGEWDASSCALELMDYGLKHMTCHLPADEAEALLKAVEEMVQAATLGPDKETPNRESPP